MKNVLILSNLNYQTQNAKKWHCVLQSCAPSIKDLMENSEGPICTAKRRFLPSKRRYRFAQNMLLSSGQRPRRQGTVWQS